MLDFTKGKPWKLLLQFAFPMLIGNVLMQLYNVVDTYIVGNYIGPEALAAVGASMPVLFALVSFIIGITMGCTIIISQYFGAKDIPNVKRAVDTVVIFVFFAALFIMVIGLLLCDPLLELVKTPTDVFEGARIFFRITLIGIIPLFGVNCISAILRGVGDSKTPLYCMIFSSILNVILVMIFVPGLNLGIAGAAWATLLAQLVTVVVMIIWLNRTNPVINITFRRLSFDPGIFRSSIRIGFPNGIQQALVAVGMMALLGIVNDFCKENSDVLVAYSVANRIDSLISAPIMTFSIAIAAFVGQNIGARKLYRVSYGLRAALAMSSGFTIVLSAAVCILARTIMQWFAPEAGPNIIDIGGRYLIIMGAFYIVFSVMFVLNGVMRGAGDTMVPMFITLLSLWLVRIPVATVLSKHLGPDGIWWSIPIAWCVGAICAFLYYRSGRWKNKGVIKQPIETTETPADIPASI